MALKYHVPFIGMPYEVWQAGPVAKDVFIDLSDVPYILKGFVRTEFRDGGIFIEAIADFDDSEFSKCEIEIMDYVLVRYGNMTASDLFLETCKKDSLWYRAISETIPVFIISTEYIYGIPVFVSNSIVSSIGSVPVFSFNAKMYLPKVSLSRKLLFKAIAFKKLIPFNKLDFPAPLAPYIAAIFNTGSFSLSIVIWLDKVVLFILGNISN